MLPLEYRLKKNSEFTQIMRLGSKAKFGCLIFFYLPSTDRIRIGVIVSKRVCKLAVDRNRHKRVIRACFSERLPQWAAKTGSVVVMVQSVPNSDEYLEYTASIDQWLKKQFSS